MRSVISVSTSHTLWDSVHQFILSFTARYPIKSWILKYCSLRQWNITTPNNITENIKSLMGEITELLVRRIQNGKCLLRGWNKLLCLSYKSDPDCFYPLFLSFQCTEYNPCFQSRCRNTEPGFQCLECPRGYNGEQIYNIVYQSCMTLCTVHIINTILKS